MNIFKPFSAKTAISTGLVMALLGVTVGCATVSPSYDNQSVYRGDKNDNNRNFNSVSKQLRQDLRRKGYQVMDIKPDSYRGERAITAYAKKNNQAYEIKYTYPSLRLISSSKKVWLNEWQGDQDNERYKKDKYKNNGKYKNDKRYKKEDVEDSIKKESRYPAIKRRAINKVRSMGYRVEDIDLEEKNKRGVFEIEAKRGSQKYEILLGYPNLNVIKIKKD